MVFAPSLWLIIVFVTSFWAAFPEHAPFQAHRPRAVQKFLKFGNQVSSVRFWKASWSEKLNSKCQTLCLHPSCLFLSKNPFKMFGMKWATITVAYCCVLIWTFCLWRCDLSGWGSRPLPLPLKRKLGGPAAQHFHWGREKGYDQHSRPLKT